MIILFYKGNKRRIDEAHREIKEKPNEERLDPKDHEEFRQYKEYTHGRYNSKKILPISSEFCRSFDLLVHDKGTKTNDHIERDQNRLESIIESERIFRIQESLLTSESETIFHFLNHYRVKLDLFPPVSREKKVTSFRESRVSGTSRIKRPRSLRLEDHLREYLEKNYRRRTL